MFIVAVTLLSKSICKSVSLLTLAGQHGQLLSELLVQQNYCLHSNLMTTDVCRKLRKCWEPYWTQYVIPIMLETLKTGTKAQVCCLLLLLAVVHIFWESYRPSSTAQETEVLLFLFFKTMLMFSMTNCQEIELEAHLLQEF